MDDATFVNDLSQVPPLRARFLADLASCTVAGDELDGWALIFTELVNNAIEHGVVAIADRVSVRWWIDDARVAVEVTDPCESGLTEQTFDDATCDSFAENGRGAGLFLIRAFVDVVRVRRPDAGGTQIYIERRRGEPGQEGSAA